MTRRQGQTAAARPWRSRTHPRRLAAICLLIVGQVAACRTADARPTATVVSTSPTARPAPADNWWRPDPVTSWEWRLDGTPVDPALDVQMVDIDLFENNAAAVARLHAAGRVVICYLNAGGWEDWRWDADAFPDAVIGRPLDGWEGERWLDVRRLDLLQPLLAARLDLCRLNGFDGVEPDNVDGYRNDTGFPLTYDDQLRFNLWLADAAHQRGLSVGLKNDLDQIGDLLPFFDWALNEECFAYDECDLLQPFLDAGKAVFHVEYHLRPEQFCRRANALDFNSLHKRLALDAYRQACR